MQPGQGEWGKGHLGPGMRTLQQLARLWPFCRTWKPWFSPSIEKEEFWSPATSEVGLSCSSSCCVTLGKSYRLSEIQFSYLRTGDKSSSYME